MATNNSFIIEDWWTKQQIELVKDYSRVWIKKAFTPTSGFWVKTTGGKMLGKTSQSEQLPEGATVDNNAWDHEHCELCMATISDIGDDQQEGYTDGNKWLCDECYNKYIVTRKNQD